MTAKLAKKWKQQLEWARAICSPFGCITEASPHEYEVATVRGNGVQLVIYPHRTSASNYHLRVRDNGSRDKAAAERVMRALDDGEGLPEKIRHLVQYCCTFSRKNH